ncbi:hypothetical protein MSAN_00259200 [Mycena sanguinolenta]|uniref:Uncharacterized protein n=1 Tax=Mycena sanguinolenta TaxID=230812 RepID=A0A8H6ZIC0_9AGAR|nr:hypothetical protein MSAN_00259200 [Mycena sanguinolenta]
MLSTYLDPAGTGLRLRPTRTSERGASLCHRSPIRPCYTPSLASSSSYPPSAALLLSSATFPPNEIVVTLKVGSGAAPLSFRSCYPWAPLYAIRGTRVHGNETWNRASVCARSCFVFAFFTHLSLKFSAPELFVPHEVTYFLRVLSFCGLICIPASQFRRTVHFSPFPASSSKLENPTAHRECNLEAFTRQHDDGGQN